VLIDVQVEKFGMLLVLLAFAQKDNSGMDTHVLSAQMEKHGILIQINAIVQ